MTSFRAASRKKRPTIKQGARIQSPQRLIEVLEREPSIWWRHRANASAFFIGWPLRQLLNELDGGNFFLVEREDEDT